MRAESRYAARLAAAVLLWLLSAIALAQPADTDTAAEPGAELQVSLFTFGPGEIYWERFGHNAIAVHDQRSGETLSFNYGIFDFEEEDFFLNFLRGHMQYSMDATTLADDIAMYRAEGRAVLEQRLALTPAQRLQLREFLLWNLRPENAKYRYEYFSSNCSTKVRDALDKVLGGAIRKSLEVRSRGNTYRLQADRLLAPIAGLMLPMDLGLGPYADRRLSFWEESFIPAALAEHIAQVQITDNQGKPAPLVVETRRWSEANARLAADDQVWLRRVGPYPIGYALPVAAVSAVLSLLLWLAARAPRPAPARVFALLACAFALSAALCGLFLLLLWCCTDHVSAWRNENLLLLNPLLLLLLPALWRTRRPDWRSGGFVRAVASAVLALALLSLAGKVLPWFTQDNAVWLALLLPPHLVLGWRLLRRDS